MVAIDMDGTLLSPLGEVTPRTKEAIHKALAAGIMICFATGRNWTESQTVLDAVCTHLGCVCWRRDGRRYPASCTALVAQ